MLKTERLVIRVASDDEMRAVIAAQTDDGLKQAYTEMLNGALTHPEERIWYAIWIIELSDGTYIGDLSFKGLSADGSVEIGYGLLGEFEGQGYATEALQAIIGELHEMGFKRILAGFFEGNTASQKVMEKCGMHLNGNIDEEEYRGKIYKCYECEMEL